MTTTAARNTSGVLLLHEPGRDASRWQAVASALAGELPVLAPELLGRGHTNPAPPTLQGQVRALLAERDARAETRADTQPVDVVGTGPSAGLAIALAAARPGLVRRLVVISGGWPAGVPSGPGQSAAEAGLVSRVGSALRRARGERPWAQEPDSRPTGVPTPSRSLVIWGARDRLLLPRHGERVVSALGRCVDPATVAMVTLPGVGHWPVDEAPDDVTALLCEFLLAS